jgi:hypothetical protein
MNEAPFTCHVIIQIDDDVQAAAGHPADGNTRVLN